MLAFVDASLNHATRARTNDGEWPRDATPNPRCFSTVRPGVLASHGPDCDLELLVPGAAIAIWRRSAFVVGVAALIGAGLMLTAPSPALAEFDPDDCRIIERHSPDDDVAFEPGVDVDGEPVAPADLPGQRGVEVSGAIAFPVTVDVFERLGVDRTDGVAIEGEIGVLRLEDGQLTFNDLPLESATSGDLAILCQ